MTEEEMRRRVEIANETGMDVDEYQRQLDRTLDDMKKCASYIHSWGGLTDTGERPIVAVALGRTQCRILLLELAKAGGGA